MLREKSSSTYVPLPGDDVESSTTSDLKYTGIPTERRPTTRSHRLVAAHVIVICLELVLLAVIVAYSMPTLDLNRPSSALSSLRKLTSNTVTRKFENGSQYLVDTNEADGYWRDLLATGGVVSMDTQAALASGLSPSFLSPSDPTQSIYQVDVFHALHCLNYLRQNIMSKDKPVFEPVHIEHCMDYLRHQLLCHPDLTLIPTQDLNEFTLDETHQCQNYDAVVDWVYKHRWVEFPAYIMNKTRHHP